MGEAFEWKLSDRQDGYGFYYGEARRGDRKVNVNVLPPAALWAGDSMMDQYKPDPKAWVIYFDGEEVARVENQGDLPQIAQQALLGNWRKPPRETMLDALRVRAARLLGMS